MLVSQQMHHQPLLSCANFTLPEVLLSVQLLFVIRGLICIFSRDVQVQG